MKAKEIILKAMKRAKREREMRLRLQQLLIGAGVLKEFTKPYVPKDKVGRQSQ